MHPSQLQKYYILVTLRKYYISKKKKTSVLQKYFHYISIKKNAEKKGKMVDWVLALLREERALNEAGLGAATAKYTVVRRVVILRKA